MKNKLFFSMAIVSALAVGFESGSQWMKRQAKDRLLEASPLLANAMIDVYGRIVNEHLTREEATAAMKSELDFIKIVLR